MNPLIASLAATLLATVAFPQAQEGTILHEPDTGATVTLPANWAFTTDDVGMIARSEDMNAMVAMASAEKGFDELREDVKSFILSRLDEVVVAKTTVVAVDELGAFEQLVAVGGTGISRKDSEPVTFSGVMLRSGDAGALVLGAWKDESGATLRQLFGTGRRMGHRPDNPEGDDQSEHQDDPAMGAEKSIAAGARDKQARERDHDAEAKGQNSFVPGKIVEHGSYAELPLSRPPDNM